MRPKPVDVTVNSCDGHGVEVVGVRRVGAKPVHITVDGDMCMRNVHNSSRRHEAIPLTRKDGTCANRVGSCASKHARQFRIGLNNQSRSATLQAPPVTLLLQAFKHQTDEEGGSSRLECRWIGGRVTYPESYTSLPRRQGHATRALVPQHQITE